MAKRLGTVHLLGRKRVVYEKPNKEMFVKTYGHRLIVGGRYITRQLNKQKKR